MGVYRGFSRVKPGGGTAGWRGELICLSRCCRFYLLPILWMGPTEAQEAERGAYGISQYGNNLSSSLGTCLGMPAIIGVPSTSSIFLASGSPLTKRQRRSRGRPSGGARRRRRGGPAAPRQQQEPARPSSEGKVTCGRCLWVLGNACTGRLQSQRVGETGPRLGCGIHSCLLLWGQQLLIICSVQMNP